MSSLEIEDLFRKGKYGRCKAILSELHSKGCDSSTLLWSLQNNLIVTKALDLDSKTDALRTECDNITKDLVDLHETILALRCVEKPPLVLQLNVVYNILWWCWINPTSNLHHDASQMEEILKILIDCFEQLLLPETIMHSTNSEELVLQLMRTTMNRVCSFEQTVCFQLFEIYVIAIQILLESNDIASYSEHIWTLVQDIWTDFKSNVLMWLKRKSDCNKLQPKLFKFGLLHLNEMVDNNIDPQLLYQALCVTSSLCYIRLGHVDESVRFFTTDETNGFQFLWNYFLSYAHFHRKEPVIGLVLLKQVPLHKLDSNARAHHQILMGELHAQMGRHSEALSAFAKAAQVWEYHCLAVYHIVRTFKSAVMPSSCNKTNTCKDEEMEIDGHTAQTRLSSIDTEYLKALQHLSEVVSTKKTIEGNNCLLSFEHKVLTSLHKQPEISKTQILYMLAKELRRQEDFDSAADVFHSVIDSFDMAESPNASVSSEVPPLREVCHEATATLLKCGRVDEAEIVCKIPLTYQAQTDDESKEDMEALLLMAEIHNRKGLYDEQNQFLNRCKKAIFKIELHGKPLSPTEQRRIHALTAKMYLQKALYFARIKDYQQDAVQNYYRATQYNPDDPEVLQHSSEFAKGLREMNLEVDTRQPVNK